jgi:hypothetical protein
MLRKTTYNANEVQPRCAAREFKKPGGLYENDKPRKTLDRRSTTVHPNDRIERSGGTRQEADYFIPQLRDHLHARTCLSVQSVWMFLRETLIEKIFPILRALRRMGSLIDVSHPPRSCITSFTSYCSAISLRPTCAFDHCLPTECYGP